MGRNRSFVIGNGESRQDYDLSFLKSIGTVYGCNINYKDIPVDKAYIADPHVIRHAVDDNANETIDLYTRSKWNITSNNVYSFPELPVKSEERVLQPRHWGTGQYAMLGACLDGCDELYMFGFDMHKPKNNKVNNIYKGSAWHWNGKRLYRDNNSRAIDPRYWIAHSRYLFEWFPNITFVFVQLKDWKIPEEWEDIPNWKLMTYDEAMRLG